MMKRTILYAAIFGACLLTACQTDDYELATVSGNEPLSLTVNATGFAEVGNGSTRAADNGKETTFESGDKVGLIVTDASGNVLADNLPYLYDGTAWSFDASNSEGKEAVYYRQSMSTYIVYYPYDASADGVASVDELKALETFSLQDDQSTEEAYRNSDLMVWSSRGTSLVKITAALSHARASFSLAPTKEVQLATGEELSYVTTDLEDVVIMKDGYSIEPYQAEDGSFRYILPDSYSGSLRWFYTYGDKTYGGEIDVAEAAAGTRYSQVEVIEKGEYTLEEAAAGDFYCIKEGTGYIIPQDASYALNEHNCIGIVFKAGAGDGDDAANYSSLSDNQIHGYAVALEDAHSEAGAWGPKEDTAIENVTEYTGIYNGYTNTQTIYETCNLDTVDLDSPTADGQYWAFAAIYAYEDSVASPANSSGWYMPSIGQLSDICNLSDRASLFTLAGGSYLGSTDFLNFYWSSTEYDEDSALLGILMGSWFFWDWFNKSNPCGNWFTPSYVRAVLTF